MKQGFSEDIGSWKIIAMSLPASRRRWRGDIAMQIVAVEGHAVGGHGRGRRQQAHDGQHRDRLARARFADDRQHLVAID